MKPGRKGLTQAQKELIWEIRATGVSDSAIARRMRVQDNRVGSYLRRAGGVRPKPRWRNDRNLSFAEREEISRGIAAKLSNRAIGRRLGRNHTTVGREIKRCGGRRRYRAQSAEQESWGRAARPKPGKLERNPELAAIVTALLKQKLSPEQIAGRLRRDYPDNELMQVSHETIYKSLYVQSRGALRKELTRQLRRGKRKRQARARAGHSDGQGQIRGMVMISERPPEADDRAVPGHWEGDLLIGAKNSAIATLVERQTRFAQLIALPEGKRAEPLSKALADSIGSLPAQLRRSLAWDQGKEMAEHARFSVATGIPVYFCDPHSPWQRGSNENTNGLLRQYFPRGTDFRRLSQARLDEVADELNRRPRKTLEFETPAEKLAEVLAQPAADR